jgi:hypothetical protein
MTNREDILDDFTLETDMSPAVLKAYLQRYPEYAADLLELFHELSMSDLEAAEALLPLETKSFGSEALRVQKVRQSLFGSGVRELANDLGLPRAFLMGLHADVVHVSSMPVAFLKNLAKTLDVRLQDLIRGMQQGGEEAVAFKADQKPKAQAALEFHDYVTSASLSEDHQLALQKLLVNDGSN